MEYYNIVLDISDEMQQCDNGDSINEELYKIHINNK